MKQPVSPQLETILLLIPSLQPNEKEAIFQQLALERSVPSWQMELVRKRKKEMEQKPGEWMSGDDFLKALE